MLLGLFFKDKLKKERVFFKRLFFSVFNFLSVFLFVIVIKCFFLKVRFVSFKFFCVLEFKRNSSFLIMFKVFLEFKILKGV